MFRSMLLAALVAVAALGMVSTASAAPKPKPSAVAPGISLDQSDPHLGDVVTFTYTLDPSIDSPRIQVVCTQNDAIVYGEAQPAGMSFTLGGGSSPWKTNGGEADCVATLYRWDFHPTQTFVFYASTSFHAGAAR